MIFVLLMGGVAFVGFFATLYQLMQIEEDPNVIVDRFLSVITIAVPPALPAAMSSGVAAAISRLR